MPSPLPGDAALDDAADALAQRVFEALPAGRSHGREAIAGLPAPLARFLLARLDARVDLDAPAPESAWVDAALARDGAEAWREAARRAARVPAPAWVGFAEQACWLVVSHLVRPAETLAAVAFEEATTVEIPATLAVNSLRAFAPYPYLHEVAARYVERKDLARVDRSELERLLRRIDRRMVAGFSAGEWADLMRPLGDLVGPLSPDGSVPSALLVAFFDARDEPGLAEAVAAEPALTPDALDAWLVQALAEARPAEPERAPAPEPDVPEPDVPEPPVPEPPAPEPMVLDADGSDMASDLSPPTDTPAETDDSATAETSPSDEARSDEAPAGDDSAGAPPTDSISADAAETRDEPVRDAEPEAAEPEIIAPQAIAASEPDRDRDPEPAPGAEPAAHTEAGSGPSQDAPPAAEAPAPPDLQGDLTVAPPEPPPRSAPEPATDASAWLSEAAMLPAESTEEAFQDVSADLSLAGEPDRRGAEAPDPTTPPEPERDGAAAVSAVSTEEPRPLWALLASPTAVARVAASDAVGAEPLWKRFASAPPALPRPPAEPRLAVSLAASLAPRPADPPETAPPSKAPAPAEVAPSSPARLSPLASPEPSPTPPPVAPREPVASPESPPPPPRSVLPRTLLPDRSGRAEEWSVPIPPVAPPRAPLPARRTRPSPAPAGDAPSLEALYRLETRVLSGTPDIERRAWFTSELFSGSEADYRATLVLLADAPSWASATDILAREMFEKHDANVYSASTVAFMTAAEARFRS